MDNPSSWLLFAGAVPLAFATKSLFAPLVYVMGLRAYKFHQAQQASPESRFFCQNTDNGQETSKAAEARETVLRAIYLDKKGVKRLDSLESLDEHLAQEI